MGAAPVVSVVDDDESVRFALGSLVRSMGYDVRLYESAEAFLDCGRAGDTAFLVSDIRMPGMSGVEMHERLIEQGIAPPTIFVSVCPSPALRARVMKNGALALFEKPLSMEAMTHCLLNVLGDIYRD